MVCSEVSMVLYANAEFSLLRVPPLLRAQDAITVIEKALLGGSCCNQAHGFPSIAWFLITLLRMPIYGKRLSNLLQAGVLPEMKAL